MASVPSTVETVVVGGGQAGLTMSAVLGDAGRDHVVLERRSTLGGGWQDRWDGFCLVTPNWSASFPGQRYEGSDPDGFMPRDEIAARVAAYEERRSRDEPAPDGGREDDPAGADREGRRPGHGGAGSG